MLVVGGGERVPGLGAVSTGVAPRAVFIDGVKVRGVHGVADLRNVGGRLPPNVTGEVHGAEERMGLQVVGPVPAQPAISTTAQLGDEVLGLGAQLDLRRDVQRVLPVYHLKRQQNQFSLPSTQGQPVVTRPTTSARTQWLRCGSAQLRGSAPPEARTVRPHAPKRDPFPSVTKTAQQKHTVPSLKRSGRPSVSCFFSYGNRFLWDCQGSHSVLTVAKRGSTGDFK